MVYVMTREWLFRCIRTELEKDFNEMESEISIFLNGCFIEQVIDKASFRSNIRIRTITGMKKSFPLYDIGGNSYGITHDEMVDILKFTKEDFVNCSLRK